MSSKVFIGCCGWSYLDERDFTAELARTYSSRLQAYVQLFDAVEINSTFYRLPRVSTASKWREEADAINPTFSFTVKAFQGITHIHRFKGESVLLFDRLREICEALQARVLLFQSPASFRPTEESIRAMRSFFKAIDRRGIICAWEPRGRWYDNTALITEVCGECRLVHCVDPLRNQPLFFGEEKLAYFRLHGFGKPSMYRYEFSGEELNRVAAHVQSLSQSLRELYLFFNNVSCYKNGREMRRIDPGAVPG